MLKKFFKGLLFGAVAGTAGGLLLAPRSGKNTRKKIIADINETAELTRDFNDSLNSFKGALDTLVSTAQELIPPFQKGIEKDIQGYKFQAEPRIKQINEHLERMNARFNGTQPESEPPASSLKRFAKN